MALGGDPAPVIGVKQLVGHNRCWLFAWGDQEAARVSEAYAEAKTFLKKGLGCLSQMTSGVTQRQHLLEGRADR